jgi:hypothetical protein
LGGNGSKWIGVGNAAYVSDPKVNAHAIVYPFGDEEYRWLLDTASDDDHGHSCFMTGNNDIPPLLHVASKSNHTLQSCQIPFYHIGNGLYPGGRSYRMNDHCRVNHNTAENTQCYGDALFITSAVIVTLKSLPQLIEDYLPTHMKPLTSLISSYLPSIENMNVPRNVSKFNDEITRSTQSCPLSPSLPLFIALVSTTVLS